MMYINAIKSVIEKVHKEVPFITRPYKDIVRKFQHRTVDLLREEFPNAMIKATAEYPLTEISDKDDYKDKADVYMDLGEFQVVIEFDTTRADQVAKKMLSRFYYINESKKRTLYLCVLYPGTQSMNPTECIKYIEMGRTLLKSVNSTNFLGGAIISNSRKLDWY